MKRRDVERSDGQKRSDDFHHWMDGIGPGEKRPTMINTHWGGVTENNHFGTHEFFDLCEQLGCEPYICGNVGKGRQDPRDALQPQPERFGRGPLPAPGQPREADLRRVLTAGEMQAHNTFDAPETIKPSEFRQITPTDEGFTALLPAKSVVVLELE